MILAHIAGAPFEEFVTPAALYAVAGALTLLAARVKIGLKRP